VTPGAHLIFIVLALIIAVVGLDTSAIPKVLVAAGGPAVRGRGVLWGAAAG
jgi:hypothetical protein